MSFVSPVLKTIRIGLSKHFRYGTQIMISERQNEIFFFFFFFNFRKKMKIEKEVIFSNALGWALNGLDTHLEHQDSRVSFRWGNILHLLCIIEYFYVSFFLIVFFLHVSHNISLQNFCYSSQKLLLSYPN